MLLKEALIIGTIGIVIGLVISILFSFGLIEYLAGVASRYNPQNISGAFLQLDYRVELKTVIPLVGIGITVILSYLIVILSCIFPIRKLSKITTIDAIRENKSEKLKAKMMKTPKIIGKLFKVEGELAYKNIRKDRSKYRMVVVTIACSIILFLIITQSYDISTYRYGRGKARFKNTQQMNATIYIEKENGDQGTEETIKYLLDNNLTDRCISARQIRADNEKAPNKLSLKISFPKTKLTEKAKKLYENQELILNEEGENYLAGSLVYYASGTIYDQVLEELGIEALNKGECIVVAPKFRTKDWKDVKVSRIEKGDKILLKETISDSGNYKETELNEMSKEEQEQLENLVKHFGGEILNEPIEEKKIDTSEINLQSYELKVAGVYEKQIPSLHTIEGSPFAIIVNKETKDEWVKGENIQEDWLSDVDFYTEDGEKVEESMDELNSILEKIDAKANWSQEYQFSVARESADKFQDTIVYIFLAIIILLLSVNVFSIIWSGITLRKKEFGALKSMGMSNKQIIKMLILECIFYGLDAFIYGSLISILILFVMYIKIVEYEYYKFYIPWNDIVFSGIVMYVIIFFAMFTKINKVFKQNIIDSIKDENV